MTEHRASAPANWENGRKVALERRRVMVDSWPAITPGRSALMLPRSPFFPFTWEVFRLPTAATIYPWTPTIYRRGS